VFLDTGADKDSALKPYQNSGLYWIEDKKVNCELGHELGLKSILMEHGHSLDYHHPAIPVVKNWREIYNTITDDPSQL
jgi:hypothetical protein